MPHTRGNEIHELFENMAYNEVSSMSTENAVAELIRKHNIPHGSNPTFIDSEELSKRLFEIADMLEKDASALNQIFSKRVPIATETPGKDIDVLISFARYYGILIGQEKLWRQVNISGGTWPENAFSSVYYTLSTIIQNSHIQSYLQNISFGPGVVLGGQSSVDTAMIVLADADLHSAVRTLTSERVGKTDYLDRPLWYLKRIWVQEPVKQKFVELINELEIKDDKSSIKSMLYGFRNRDEVMKNLGEQIHVKAVGIWSRDVVAAKNMANSAEKVFLVWINSYGEIGPGISLPWTDVEHHNVGSDLDSELKFHARDEGKKTVDLFYDGAWKEPIDECYWEDSTGVLWANAKCNDVEKCAASADKAFKKWHLLPLSERRKCFDRLANRIQMNGDASLARLIHCWAEWPSLYGCASSRIQDDAVEIMTVREPKGTIAIASDDRVQLFRRIVCAAIAGNSVIVVNHRTGSTNSIPGLEEYCDRFATCGFPPGVVNSLFFDDLSRAVGALTKCRSVSVICTDIFHDTVNDSAKSCSFPNYWTNTKIQDGTSDEKLYGKYTRPKSVWLPLK